MDVRASVVLDLATPWAAQVLTVAPLVVVGTVEPDGSADLAPKHMVMPVGDRHVAFTCSPSHATHVNLRRTGAFTVAWPRQDAVLATSLGAAPRADDGSKPSLAAVPARRATAVEAWALADARLVLECRLDRVVDGYGPWSVVVGEVVHAEAAADAVLAHDEDPHDVLARSPVLAHVPPAHVAVVERAHRFPFHAGFAR